MDQNWLKFGSHRDPDTGFLKDSSTLPARAFFHNFAHISGEKNDHENFILDLRKRKSLLNFGSNLDQDLVSLAEVCSSSVLAYVYRRWEMWLSRHRCARDMSREADIASCPSVCLSVCPRKICNGKLLNENWYNRVCEYVSSWTI